MVRRSNAMTRLGLAASVAAGALLSGCASVTPVPTTVEMAGMPNPEAALQQSISHVDAEMAELGQLTSSATRVDQPPVPEDLRRTVTFTWNGPLDEGVAKLAASIGYTFYTTGPASQQPLNVAIQISSVPVYQVFQALGEEAGAQATVQVDPQHHQVQVIHHV
jgi:defect-in-organelle-trafficking protein DotD